MGLLDNLKSMTGNKTSAESATPLAEAKKVMIIEDDDLLGKFYEDLFRDQKFNVIRAVNGQDGLDKIVTLKPDIVLLDLMMPVMDGKTMLHKLRQIPEFEKLPVIVLTNAGDDESMRETQLFDIANGFLIKSNVNPNDIILRVKSLL